MDHRCCGVAFTVVTMLLGATNTAVGQARPPARGGVYLPAYRPYYPYGFGYGYGLGVGIALANPNAGRPAYAVIAGPPYRAVPPNSLGLAVPPIFVESGAAPRPKLEVLPFPTREPDVTPLPAPRPLPDN